MKKAILCPLLVAIATMSIQAPAHGDEPAADSAPAPVPAQAPAPADTVIDLPPMIDPNNIDDQKLGEIVETLRQSRLSAINTLGNNVHDTGRIVAVGAFGSLAGGATSQELAVYGAKKNWSPKLVRALSRNGGALLRFADTGMNAALIVMGTGIAIQLYETLHKLSAKDSALMMQSSGDLDALFKHDNQEIVAMANRDAKLKKQLVNMYQAILIINQPPAN